MRFQTGDRVAFTTAKGYAMTGAIFANEAKGYGIDGDDGSTYWRREDDILGLAR